MLLNWLANAVAARLPRGEDERITAALQRLDDAAQRQRKEARELIDEMDDVMERFHRVMAREAMRRSRAMKKNLEEVDETQERDVQGREEAPAPTARSRKAAIWDRINARRHVQNGGSE